MEEDEDSENVSETNFCYKQRLEKSTGAEMVLMRWSPVADLLAAAFSDHSVSLSLNDLFFSFCNKALCIQNRLNLGYQVHLPHLISSGVYYRWY